MILTIIAGVFYFLSPVLFFVCGVAEGLVLSNDITSKTFKDSAITTGITAIFVIMHCVNAVALWL